MTLLSPLALLFAAAALVPLLLHLYQRRRKIVVLFSTNRFFTRSVVRSQRRLRLRKILLLMLRMAACILFAFALARPILGLAALTGVGTGNRDLVVLLDDSLSMQALLPRAQEARRHGSLGTDAMPDPLGAVPGALSERSESKGDGHAWPSATSTPTSRRESVENGGSSDREEGVAPVAPVRSSGFSRAVVAPTGAKDPPGGGTTSAHRGPYQGSGPSGPGMAPTTQPEVSNSLDSELSATRLDRAKAAAIEILNTLARGDRAAVVTFSGCTLGQDTRGGMQLTPDITHLVEQVQQLKTTAAGDAPAALKQAAELLKGGSQRARSLLILTDLQAGDWGQAAWPQPETPVRTVLAQLDPPTRDNLLVDQVLLAQGTAVVGQPNLLGVRLVNHRQRPAQAQLVLTVDGKEIARHPVELPGTGPQVERMPVVFDTSGEHSLVASIDAADALPADDTFFATVQVNPRLPVLLVNGDVETAGQKPASFYLQAAMQAVSDDPTADSIPVQLIAPADLAGAKLDRYRVVVLCNVADLPAAQVAQLEQFVQAGGGLAILLGDRCDAKFYNQVLGAPSRPLGSLMPADMRSRLGGEGAVEPLHITEAEMDHPLFTRFKGTLRGALAGISIYQAHGLAPRDGWTLASMDGQLPLIVERRYGQGRAIIFGTLPKPSWTDWPLRRAFIPLVNSLVSHLAGGASIAADQAACQDLLLGAAIRSIDQPPKVRRPDGSLVQARVRMAGSEPLAYVPADLVGQVGLYRVELGAGSSQILAVNAPRRESLPDTIDADEAIKRAGRWQLTVADLTGRGSGPASLAPALSSSPGSTGIWNTLLWAVFAIIAVEPLIANRRVTGASGEGRGTSGE